MNEGRPERSRNVFIAVALFWTLALAGGGWWNDREATLAMERTVIQVARESYQKDVAYRKWAARQGGVYVPETKQMPANPYLSNIPERDVVTPSGRLLTLVNPAYMNRMVNEVEKEMYGHGGHITSLKPMRPENSPDNWERNALLQIKGGAKEVFSFDESSGGTQLRFLGALITEKACLKCHADQGYEEGDARGGLGVSIAWEPYRLVLNARRDMNLIQIGLVWLAGLVGLSVAWMQVSKALDRNRRAEQEIRQLNIDLEARVQERTAQLEASVEELEAFSYTISHDLRAPLRAIDGFSAMVVERHGRQLEAEAQRLLGVVRANARRMARLIDDLLAFVRIGRSEMRCSRLNMGEMARSAFEEIVDDPERRGKIDFRVGDLPEVAGDAALVRQVWVNLLSNAVKFSSLKENPVIEIEGALEKDRAVYRVRDNGAGFDMAYAGKLFGVFQRLHGANEFEGTGVGLALVQRIVTRHGGRVWAEGAVGQGATISFELPATR